ncbi:uncharacterized protein EURHEDRAFT_102217 [Aspergillus ruber CBS 135680]|uniref:Uncharacterized protein n=1 Tax=Aspergillus ruber (strain CBS 135680) TaxID=1388766 RepID=A0A017SB82_ASPRC|nr:uncharacterized protein EURHEDRAFT_102217 [Aspergillus ruber CBS 135680]EYE94303.1 hypothetical protein EURHEDRAFT_102217 [Aspergillus ruber CBS 135680]
MRYSGSTLWLVTSNYCFSSSPSYCARLYILNDVSVMAADGLAFGAVKANCSSLIAASRWKAKRNSAVYQSSALASQYHLCHGLAV